MSNDNNEKKSENIFEIMDGMMFQLNKTKKMFVIMILTVLILPPIGLLVMINTFDPPWEERGVEHSEQLIQDLEELLGDNFSDEEADQLRERIQEKHEERKQEFLGEHTKPLLYKSPQLVIFVISIIWLGIGIRQWFVLSKFSKRYETFKKRQEEIDKKLDEETKNEKNDS